MKNRGAILITGASTGLGRACALRLDALGFRVFASALSLEEGAELKSKASSRLEIVVLDIRDETSIAGALQTLSAATGEVGLKGLVNNAGILNCAPLELLAIARVRQVFEVNVIGQIAVTQAMLPLLRRGKGRIINIGSLAGRSALPFTSPYNASKWALRALSNTWRTELRRQGIVVTLIEPGMVATPIWKSSDPTGDLSGAEAELAAQFYPSFGAQAAQAAQLAQRSGLTPDHIARVVARALLSARPKARYTLGKEAGQLLVLEGLPAPLRDWLVARRFGV